MFSVNDHIHMARALLLAERGLLTTDPNPRVGCVLLRDEKLVGEGWHQRSGEAHAEVIALKQAGELAKGATAYVTLEPCSHHGQTPPCAEALIKAGVSRVVTAMKDPSPKVAGKGLAILEAAGIQVESGLLKTQAEQLNPGFVSRFVRGRPYVRCKIAMSLDGRTALANGESKWITSAAARQDVHALRARSSVIVTGIETVIIDDARLNARIDGELKQPDRVVLDTKLRMPLEAKMLSLPGTMWIATAEKDSSKRQALAEKGARFIDLQTIENSSRLDLNALLQALTDLEYNEVLLESGPTLSGAFIAAGLVDELIVYMAPHIMGSDARGLFNLPPIDEMNQRLSLEIKDVRQLGSDLRLTLKPANEKQD